MASSTFVFASSDSGAGVVVFGCFVLLLSYHPYVTDRVVFTFRLTFELILNVLHLISSCKACDLLNQLIHTKMFHSCRLI